MSEQVKPSTDWETIEKDWRAGIKTKLQMSKEYEISRAAMDKHFAKLGIDRDLTEKIRARAESLVTQQAVTDLVTQERLVTTEREIVEVNAQMQANAIKAHRTVIGRQQRLLDMHLDELEAMSANKEMFEQLGEIMYAPDEKGQDKRNALYMKVIDMPTRVDVAKKAAETSKLLVGLERQAFGIADNAEGDKPPAPISATSDTEIAKRLAFILSKAAV